jgi:thiol-disulfide isomerase/thioredoxin
MRRLTQLLIAFLLLNAKIVSAQAPTQVPNFSFQELFTSKSFKTADLPQEGLIIFNYYDTGCSHCQKMGAGIAQQIQSFKNVNFYFVAMNDVDYVEGFINMFAKKLKPNPHVSFIWDKNGQFITLFKPTQTPSLYIYDAKTRKLLKHLDGIDDVKELQVALQQLTK